jgi:O-antigen/teichoic acid export membrane protein
MLTMGGQHWYVAWTTALSQLGNLILAIVLIQRMGIIGVAIATFVAVASINLVFLQGKAGRLHARSRLDYYRKTVLPSLVPGLIMAGAVLGLLQVWPMKHLWDVAILEGIAIVTFSVSFWFLGLKREERSYFFERVRNR